MTCADCGGLVLWCGPMSNLTHTECNGCGGINCQVPEDEEYADCDGDEQEQAK